MQAPARKPRPRKRVEQLVAYCRSNFEQTGIVPSYSMIADELRMFDAGTVRRCVKQAEAAGLITLADYRGGRGPRRGQRIRLGTPAEAAEGRKVLRLGSEIAQAD